MSKYAPLGAFLRRQRSDEVRMTFAQIERIIGTKLPPSTRYRAWWSNNATNSVMTKVWLEAGFKSEQVDLESRKVVFRRLKARQRSLSKPEEEREKYHPLFGALKDVTRIPPGVDLTEPADPEWGAAD
jgi:hypothetical protein